MTSKHQEPLEQTAARVLEEWAMMLVEPSLEAPHGELYQSKIDFQGMPSGSMTIVAPKAFLPLLAKNVLGVESVDGDEECQDAFRELANVMAGNFLTVAFGFDRVFSLIQPVVSKVSEGTEIKEGVEACTHLVVDDQPVSVAFSLKE